MDKYERESIRNTLDQVDVASARFAIFVAGTVVFGLWLASGVLALLLDDPNPFIAGSIVLGGTLVVFAFGVLGAWIERKTRRK